ncbi:MAG TPA: vWA domain-containing protein, partial [Fimbriimonas sp.]|nr:vWA domain-containing protein [Fimbriimonas sp.]
DAAFYAAFGNVEPAGKRTLLALDVSGSMAYGEIAGVPGLTPRDASAAMALVTAATEPSYEVVGFMHELAPLAISPRQRLDDAIRTVSNLPFGATDCAQPMRYALEQRREIDTFVVYTDSETWAGNKHLDVVLDEYRKKKNRNVKVVIAAMTANRSTVGDPQDLAILQTLGFDASLPSVIAAFVGRATGVEE